MARERWKGGKNTGEVGWDIRSILVVRRGRKEQAPRAVPEPRGLSKAHYFFFAALFGFACFSLRAARAAASFAIVTRKGEQLT
ncbi:MAG: hypothetical protein A4E61_00743 [Syntrophorhabdus sp. PtaB.Bin184]|nr:MAG: hypothetical protein A4E61_00743 [Syntrophorhabdus sp. PtaB.Bin184]